MLFAKVIAWLSFFWSRSKSFLSRVFMFFFRKTCFLDLKYPECFKFQYPVAYPIANQITQELISDLEGRDFTLLTPNASDLNNFGWKSYFNCSLIRMLKVSDFLSKLSPGLKILDVGSYFGNFPLFCSGLGHTVDIVDSYKAYGPALDFVLDKFKRKRITVHEIADVGYDLSGLKKNSYDVVLCLGLIEHIPHTPRVLF